MTDVTWERLFGTVGKSQVSTLVSVPVPAPAEGYSHPGKSANQLVFGLVWRCRIELLGIND